MKQLPDSPWIRQIVCCLFVCCLFACGLLVIWADPAVADIYRYRDDNGNWCFTDTPPAGDNIERIDSVEGRGKGQQVARNIDVILKKQYAPASGVETATLATVTVMSPAGKGSGFFIRDDGYLITNRHVLRGDTESYRAAATAMENVDAEMNNADHHLGKEADALGAAFAHLEQFRQGLEEIGSPAEREAARIAYEKELARVRALQANFDSRKNRFENGKAAYESEKYDFNYRKITATLSRQFKLILKDGTEIDAHLVRESRDHDLALLKVDGYITPHLPPGRDDFRQGGSVYAIGSPVELHNSVSRGILSGHENGFLKTDARIYPGNSGGPLINPDGEVLGINTFKQLTRNFEGLGFAIPIRTALEEFKDELE